MSADQVPERPAWQRPPFEPGNVLARTHGARSPRMYGPFSRDLVAGLLADRPDLAAFPEVVTAWADAEARCHVLRVWLAEDGMIAADGTMKDGPLKWLSAFDRRANELRGRLGLDPRAAADLARERADAGRSMFDLDAVLARGRDVRAAAEAAQLLPAVSGPAVAVPNGPDGPAGAERSETTVGS